MTRRFLLCFGAIFFLALSARAECEPDSENRVSLDYRRDETQKWQNMYADEDGLERIKDDAERERLIKQGALVPIHDAFLRETEATTHVRIDPRLEVKKRWVRPCTKQYLLNLAAKFYEQFQKSLQVNSAVRTVAEQKSLGRPGGNGNAAPFSGPEASTHLTGATIDVAKMEDVRVRGKAKRRLMPVEQLNMLRNEILGHEAAGSVEATEEQYQAVFHIFVRKCYVD